MYIKTGTFKFFHFVLSLFVNDPFFFSKYRGKFVRLVNNNNFSSLFERFKIVNFFVRFLKKIIFLFLWTIHFVRFFQRHPFPRTNFVCSQKLRSFSKKSFVKKSSSLGVPFRASKSNNILTRTSKELKWFNWCTVPCCRL